MRLLLQPEHAGQAERHFDATRARRSSTTASGSAPTRTVTSPSSIPPTRAAPAAWSTRRSSRPARGGLRPAHADDPEDVIDPRGRPPVLVRHGRQQRVRGRVDGRGAQHVLRSARADGAGDVPTYLQLRYFGGFVPYVFKDIRARPRDRLEPVCGLPARREERSRSRRRATSTIPAPGSVITYNKTALWLNTLERWLGWPTLQRIAVHVLRALAVQASEAG